MAARYAFAVLKDYSSGLFFKRLDFLYGAVLMDGDVGVAFQLVDNGQENVEGLAGCGIHAVATLYGQSYAALLKELHQLMVEEAPIGIAQETAVAANVWQGVAQSIGVGEVAAPFAGDAQLAARLVHLLEKQHAATTAGSGDGCHKSGGAGTDNGYIVVHQTFAETLI